MPIFNNLPAIVYQLMVGFIFLNPIPHTTSLKELLFYLSVILLGWAVATRKTALVYRSPLTVPLLLFGAWSLFDLAFALNKVGSLHDFYDHYLKNILLFFILLNVVDDQQRFQRLLRLIIISAVGFSAWALVQNYVVLGNPLASRMGSASGLPEFVTNVSELISILALLFTLHQLSTEKPGPGKIFLLLGLIPLLAAAILPQSRSSLIALAVGLLIMLARKPKLLAALIVTLLIALPTIPRPERLSSEFGESRERLFLALLAIEVIKDHPLTGTGFDITSIAYIKDALPEQYQGYRNTVVKEYQIPPTVIFQPWPHNMFLSLMMRTGAIGLLLFLNLIRANLQMSWQLIRHGSEPFIRGWALTLAAAFLTFIAKGMFEPVFTQFCDTIFYSLLALNTLLWRFNREKA